MTTGGYMQLSIDPELKSSTEEYKHTKDKLKRQLHHPPVQDDQSKALVGTGLSSLNPKNSDQWLTFAGSQREKSEGVIDSFTGKLEPTNI